MTEMSATYRLSTCRAIHAPDARTTCFDLEVESDGNGVSLAGAVSNRCLLEAASEAIADATNHSPDTDDVSILEDLRSEYTVAEGVVPIRAEPTADAERVTSALYGAKLPGFDTSGEWLRVRTPDGYLGWVARETAIDSRPITVDAVITSVELHQDGETPLYAGTECDIVGTTEDTVRARFRTGAERDLLLDAVAETPSSTGDTVVETARRFQGTTYEWGGMTVDGIDCSGLVWIAYRAAGVVLPRDSDQQRRVGHEVARDELRAGDLLFFPGHVAISTGGTEFLHAYGPDDRVVSNSLDPASEQYLPGLDESFDLAKRVIHR